MGDLRAVGRQDVPRGAELVDGLTGGVAGLGVAGEVVERVTVVGHLGGAVGSPGGTEQRGADPPAGFRGPGNGERWPHARARRVASAGGRLVRGEVIERAA